MHRHRYINRIVRIVEHKYCHVICLWLYDLFYISPTTELIFHNAAIYNSETTSYNIDKGFKLYLLSLLKHKLVQRRYDIKSQLVQVLYIVLKKTIVEFHWNGDDWTYLA